MTSTKSRFLTVNVSFPDTPKFISVNNHNNNNNNNNNNDNDNNSNNIRTSSVEIEYFEFGVVDDVDDASYSDGYSSQSLSHTHSHSHIHTHTHTHTHSRAVPSAAPAAFYPPVNKFHGIKTIIALHPYMMTGEYFLFLHQLARQNNVRILAPSLPCWGRSSCVFSSIGHGVVDISIPVVAKILNQFLQQRLKLDDENDNNKSENKKQYSKLVNILAVGEASGYGLGLASESSVVFDVALYVPLPPTSAYFDPFGCHAPMSSLRTSLSVLENRFLSPLFSHFIVAPIIKYYDTETAMKLTVPGLRDMQKYQEEEEKEKKNEEEKRIQQQITQHIRHVSKKSIERTSLGLSSMFSFVLGRGDYSSSYDVSRSARGHVSIFSLSSEHCDYICDGSTKHWEGILGKRNVIETILNSTYHMALRNIEPELAEWIQKIRV